MASEGGVNMDFVRSVPGIVRFCELVVSICAIISIVSGSWCLYPGAFGFYQTAVISATVLVFLIIIVFLFRLDQTIGTHIDLTITLLLNDCILTLFYFIASIIAFVLVGNCSDALWGHGGRISAAIFAVLGTGLFAYSSFLDYKAYKERATERATAQPQQTYGT